MAGRIVHLLLRSTTRNCQLNKSINWFQQIKYYSAGSYFHSVSPVPISGLTLSQVLDRAVDKYAGNEAVVDCEQKIRKTYSDYRHDVDKLAAGFLALNLKKGDRIGLWSPNSYQWLITQLAAARLGLIMVSMNAFNQAREMEYCLRKAGCRVLVAAENCRQMQYYPILQQVLPELANGKEIIKTEKLPNLERIIMVSDKQFAGTLKFDDISAAGGSKEIADLELAKKSIQIHDPASIYFTSGTAGLPKAVLLSNQSIVNFALDSCHRSQFDDTRPTQHRVAALGPLFHVLGGVSVANGPLWYGQCVVLPASMYSAQKCLEAFHHEKVTFCVGTPTMLMDIFNHPDFAKYDLSEFGGGIFGGQPIPRELIKLCEDRFKTNQIKILPGYGITETSGAISLVNGLDDPSVRYNTVGKPFSHTEVKLVDANGDVVPCNTPGEVLVRGYVTMIKYWEDEENTKAAFTPDRWFKTGDIGKMDENGFLTLVGRTSDMIIRGGANIYPTEVENYISSNPKIAAVQVFGIPDNRLGEKLCAFVILKQGEQMTEQDLATFCDKKIAAYKIPEHVKFVQDFPKLGTGKVNKALMKEQLIAELSI